MVCVVPRLSPRDVKDMSCVSCGKKGHMARDCRQSRQEDKSKRPCFVCGKVGHLAQDCRDKPNALKMLENGEPRQPVFLGCVNAVDAEGYRRVRRPQPRGAHILDFISRAAAPVQAKKPDGNRFRPLQVSDLTTNATHKEEESADCVVSGVCAS